MSTRRKKSDANKDTFWQRQNVWIQIWNLYTVDEINSQQPPNEKLVAQQEYTMWQYWNLVTTIPLRTTALFRLKNHTIILFHQKNREKLVAILLTDYLELNNLLYEHQCGLQSTVDH